MTAYADRRGHLDAEILVDTGAYSVWPFTACLEAAQAGGNLPGPLRLAAYPVQDLPRSPPTNRPSHHTVASLSSAAIELTIDAVARAVRTEAWEVRAENLVPAAAMPY